MKRAILILLITAIAGYSWAEDTSYMQCGHIADTHIECYPNGPDTAINSVYLTSGEAFQARDDWLVANPSWSTGLGHWGGVYNYDSAVWDAYVAIRTNTNTAECGSTVLLKDRYFLYPKAGQEACFGAPDLDPDGDGLSDDCDPYPGDPTDVPFQLLSGQGPSNAPTYLTIQTTRGDIISYGTYDGGSMEFIIMDPTYYTGSKLCTLGICCADTVGGSPASGSQITGGTVVHGDTPDPTTQTGEDSAGNTTDTEHLEDIVNNTDKIADNQGVVSDLLESIDKRLGNLEQGQGYGPGVVPGGEGSGLDSSGVGDGVKSGHEALGDEYGDDMQSHSDAITAQDPQFDGVITEEDNPEEDLLSDFWDTVIASSPVATYLNGSSVTASGACSFSWLYNGNSVNFTVCNYETEMQAFGAVLLAFTTMWSLIYVFRR